MCGIGYALSDIPRKRGYYRGGRVDAIGSTVIYTPVQGNSGAAPQIPVVGLIVLAGIVLAFEHFRKGR